MGTETKQTQAEQVQTPKVRLWTRSYVSLLLANLGVFLGFYLPMPALTTYVAQLGGGAFEIGGAIAATASAALVFRFVGGVLSDAIGIRPVAVIGMALTLFVLIMYLFTTARGMVWLRLGHGVGWGLSTSALATAVSRNVPKERSGEGMGYYALAMIVAMTMTPSLSIVLMNRWGFSSLSLLAAGVLAIGLLIMITLRDLAKGAEERRRFTRRNLVEKSALFPALLCIFLTMAISGLLLQMIPFGREIGVNDTWTYYIGFAVVVIGTRQYAGRLYDRRGHREIIPVGCVFMLAGLVLLSQARDVVTLAVSALPFALGYGAVYPSLQAWAVSEAEPRYKGVANGTYLSSIDLGYALSAILLVPIGVRESYSLMFLYSSGNIVVIMVCYIAYMFIRRMKGKKKPAAAV